MSADPTAIRQWIAEMRELEKRATPGPWRSDDPDNPEDVESDTNFVATVHCVGIDGPWPDRDVIVAARNALPALLDCVGALEYIGELHGWWEDCGDHCPNTCDGCMARAALVKLAEACK